jgi:cysteine-rich repeat protein
MLSYRGGVWASVILCSTGIVVAQVEQARRGDLKPPTSSPITGIPSSTSVRWLSTIHCGRDFVRSEDLASLPAGIKMQHRAAGAVAGVGAFDIVLNAGPTLTANSSALAAFQSAVAIWESKLIDPVTVVIDAELAVLGVGILGQAGSRSFFGDYNTMRNVLFAESLLPLPEFTEYDVILPAGFTLARDLTATKANFRALGFDMSFDDSFADASITFNTLFLSQFDFDPTDGISDGLFDFQAIIVHEIGHALGFVSAVDQVDGYMGSGQVGTVRLRTLDMFRLRPGDGDADFTLNPRIGAPGNVEADHAFFNGMSDLALSTGRSFGDGNQASHWKADEISGFNIGVMDPTLATGVPQLLTEADLRAFGLIGWDLVGDCNANGIPDNCDLECGVVDGVCDVPGCGNKLDCNLNGVPDECDLTPPLSVCDDSNPCTVDMCDPVLGCLSDGTGIFGPCDDGDLCTADDSCSGDALGTCIGLTSAATCGDGVYCSPEEFCDDGYTDACGSCNSDCTGFGTGAVCGDGDLCPETEQCDDGDTQPGDGCDGSCTFEPSPAPQQKVIAPDAQQDSEFGISTSIDGEVAVIGADQNDNQGTIDNGSAYIYRRNSGVWDFEQKLTPPAGVSGGFFGRAVAISGDVVLVGSPSDNEQGSGAGAAHVYRLNAGVWSHEQKLTASDGAAGDLFGWAVTLDGDVALIGAVSDDDKFVDSGAAYVFRYSAGSWSQEQKLTATDAEWRDWYGASVAIDGDMALVGVWQDDDACPQDPACNSGSAHVYRYVNGTWSHEQKLTAADGSAGDWFGLAASLDGNTALVGARLDDDACPLNANCESGSAYVFRRTGGLWSQEQKLTAIDGSQNAAFGSSVSIKANLALVGASGATGNVPWTGAAYLYRHAAGVWTLNHKLTASDGTGGETFGIAVSLSSDEVLVGAEREDKHTGSAYFFTVVVCGNGWEEGQEECDDGVANSNVLADACRSDCMKARCGDGVTDTGEECDDGDNDGGDGCSPGCAVEPGFNCIGQPSVCTSSCDDGNSCTADLWDPVNVVCINDGTGVATGCDDNNACTTGDVCQGDVAGTCQGADTSAADCNDGNPCTLDTCDTATGCEHDGTGVTIDCNDSNACTTSDVCLGDAAGTCAGIDTSAVDCSDANLCTVDVCDPVAGCSSDGTGVTLACDDNNACTTSDICQGDEAGNCVGLYQDSDADGVCDANDDCVGDQALVGLPCDSSDDADDCETGDYDCSTGTLVCTDDAASDDADADGVCDLSDNCPTIENPQQEDCNEDGVGDACTLPATPEVQLAGMNKERFVSIVVPAEDTCHSTALQVTLNRLYNPGAPLPVDPPDFSAREGEIRYVNLLRDEFDVPVTSCLSSPSFVTYYRCATVGCDPEYADWAELFGGETIHVSGSSIVPDSTYTVVQLSLSCNGNEAACMAVSESLQLATARHGDVDANGLVNVTDIVLTVDVVKDVLGAVWEHQCYVRKESPEPQNDSTNVTDIVLHVDAVKLTAYAFDVPSCP